MSKPARSNLQQRVLSGIVLIILALALTFAGGVWYRLLAAAISGAVLYEWLAMTTAASQPASSRFVASGFLAILLALLIGGLSASFLLPVLGVAILVTLAHSFSVGTGFWAAGGLAYAGLLGIALAALRGDSMAGLQATLLLFAVVWATDIMAYFTGRALGGPKLAPAISPGKTWSGAIGGTTAAILAGLVVAYYFTSPLGWAAFAGLSLLLSVVSQIGDLFESWIKRRFGVKDSGNLIPGHGGVMDRVDGLATATFTLFLLGLLLAGPDNPAAAFFGS